jgi:hypothetical protein
MLKSHTIDLHIFLQIYVKSNPRTHHEAGSSHINPVHALPLYLKERDHLQYLGIDGRIILKWIFNKKEQSMWIGFIWLRIGIHGGLL